MIILITIIKKQGEAEKRGHHHLKKVLT